MKSLTCDKEKVTLKLNFRQSINFQDPWGKKQEKKHWQNLTKTFRAEFLYLKLRIFKTKCTYNSPLSSLENQPTTVASMKLGPIFPSVNSLVVISTTGGKLYLLHKKEICL